MKRILIVFCLCLFTGIVKADHYEWQFDTQQSGFIPAGNNSDATLFGIGMQWSNGAWTTNVDYIAGFSISIPGESNLYLQSTINYEYVGNQPLLLDSEPKGLLREKTLTYERWTFPPSSKVFMPLQVPKFTSLDSLTVDTLLTKPGDVNYDNLVNAFDINLISSNWNHSGDSDANLDGITNIFDINLVSSHWTGTPVPEPSTIVLLLIGFFFLLGCKYVSK